MKNASDIGQWKQNLPNYDSLLALIAFAGTQDSVKAARQLQISQPALSFHLKKIESQLDFPVFAFAGKKKVLTKAGQAYVESISSKMEGLFQAHQEMLKATRSIETQSIRIAGRRELLLPLLGFPFPGQIEFFQTTSQDALTKLKDHSADVAIATTIPESSEVVAKLFFESGFQLIAPVGWKFDVESLQDKPVIAYGLQHTYLNQFLESSNLALDHARITRVVEDWYSVVELVRMQQGWAVIPDSWAIHTPQVKAQKISAEKMPKQKVYWIYRRSDRKSAWVKLLEDWQKSLHT